MGADAGGRGRGAGGDGKGAGGDGRGVGGDGRGAGGYGDSRDLEWWEEREAGADGHGVHSVDESALEEVP